MSTPVTIGSVASLFPHIEKEWWKNVFDEFYLRTDGDVVEDPRVTEAECEEILRLPHVNRLFTQERESRHQGQVRILDLCCGQRRHSIWLAERYPDVQFHRLDSSSYLIELANKRAAKLPNVCFSKGNAGPIPAEEPFDLVLLMGNSFGYGDQASDIEMLHHIFNVLKPGGLFLMDIPDAEWLQSAMNERSWEWIDGRDADTIVAAQCCAANPLGTKLLVCRERELNASKDVLACREIIISLAQGVVKDNFYSTRLYKRGRLEQILAECGFAVHPDGVSYQPQSERNQDLGMMGQRHLVLAQKPDFDASQLPINDSEDFYVHPALTISFVPEKGRRVLATDDISAGTLLFAAKPYAMVPSLEPCRGTFFICSNQKCGKKMEKATADVEACFCIEDVVWCNAACRAHDESRHELECGWLQKFTNDIIAKFGAYDFNMLWIVVRVMCQRLIELKTHNGSRAGGETASDATSSEDELRAHGANTWDNVFMLLANQDRFPAAKLAHWSTLSETYLAGQPFADGFSIPDTVSLICKEETNSFGMYPKTTGMHPHPGPQGTRGIAYGLALHHQASFFNHSCLPNVMHGPDHVSRMVMHATRDITTGEECCITYFDLAERDSIEARRELLTRFFNFECNCRRCEWEAGLELEA